MASLSVKARRHHAFDLLAERNHKLRSNCSLTRGSYALRFRRNVLMCKSDPSPGSFPRLRRFSSPLVFFFSLMDFFSFSAAPDISVSAIRLSEGSFGSSWTRAESYFNTRGVLTLGKPLASFSKGAMRRIFN